jgi:hypothetical protein
MNPRELFEQNPVEVEVIIALGGSQFFRGDGPAADDFGEMFGYDIAIHLFQVYHRIIRQRAREADSGD